MEGTERDLMSPVSRDPVIKFIEDKEMRKAVINYQFSETPLSKRQKTSASIDLV
jgi:hypothetical protein